MTITSAASYPSTTETSTARTAAADVPSIAVAAQRDWPTTRLGWWRHLVAAEQDRSNRRDSDQPPCPLVGPTRATLWTGPV